MPFELKAAFFAHIREALLGGRLSQAYVDGCNALAAKFDGTIDEFAYVLATAHHETAHTLKPVSEYGKRSYFNKYDGRADLGNIKPGDGYRYRGRGFVQITGRANYRKFGMEDDPDTALKPDVAALVAVRGMRTGIFTGKKLSDYFSAKKCDPVGARRIINGTDRAKLIAGHWSVFKEALELDASSADTEPTASATTGKAMSQSTIVGASTGIGLLSALQLLGDALGQAKTHLQPIIDILPASPTHIALTATVGLAIYIAYRRYKHSQEDGF